MSTVVKVFAWSDNRRSAIVALLGVVAFAVCLAVSPGLRQAMVLATTKQPERYTELFFSDPRTLAKTFSAGSPVTVAFSLRNHEGRPRSYTYSVAVDGRRVRTGRTPLVADSAEVTESETVRIDTTAGQAEVEVVIPETQQRIHFWTRREGGGR